MDSKPPDRLGQVTRQPPSTIETAPSNCPSSSRPLGQVTRQARDRPVKSPVKLETARSPAGRSDAAQPGQPSGTGSAAPPRPMTPSTGPAPPKTPICPFLQPAMDFCRPKVSYLGLPDKGYVSEGGQSSKKRKASRRHLSTPSTDIVDVGRHQVDRGSTRKAISSSDRRPGRPGRSQPRIERSCDRSSKGPSLEGEEARCCGT